MGLTGQAVRHDFDSLLEHNPLFGEFMRNTFDTFQIFGPDEPLEFTVYSDFRALSKNKFKDEYQQAEVVFQLWDSILISRDIRIKPRGDFRLKNCSQAPLRVNVKKTKQVFQLLDDLNKLKLVVPCKGANIYQDYIFREYLAYKLYNVITDNSFRVRLIKVNYHDTGGKLKPNSAYTFIIESPKSLAERQHSIQIKSEKISSISLDEENAARLYLFQFMIGNTDWSITGLHNIRLLKTKDVTRPYPLAVPYDFDYCGLVNASYAFPGDHVDIKEVTDRVYMGYCLPEEILNSAFEQFIEKEAEIMATVHNFEQMPDNSKKKALDYLEKFYDIIKEPKRRGYQIERKCKKPI